MKSISKKTLKSILIICILFSTNLYLSAQVISVSSYYKTDRDGDGVPDVRDQCPDTDKLLESDTVYTDVGGGKIVPIKLYNIKKNFIERRRRIMVERSRLLRKRKYAQTEMDGLKRKETSRRDALKNQIDSLNRLVKLKDTALTKSVYETKITLEGQQIRLEIPVMVDEWGCLRDTDGDGVPDLKDKCVKTPGEKKLHGCPDRDKDGIIDNEDDCPDEPGIARLHGCPERDRDGDGILDKEDECPDEPGIARLNGCPERDRDGDGVLDKDDKCPDVPGSPANKGCPEVIAKHEQKILDEASKVLFHVGSYIIKPQSYGILDKVVGLLNKYPDSHIALEGHTDSDGSRYANQILSQNRAKSVRNYLVKKGIKANRITFAGFGESKLLVKPEKTPQDKQKNRRVMMHVTNKK